MMKLILTERNIHRKSDKVFFADIVTEFVIEKQKNTQIYLQIRCYKN